MALSEYVYIFIYECFKCLFACAVVPCKCNEKLLDLCGCRIATPSIVKEPMLNVLVPAVYTLNYHYISKHI